MAQYPPGYFDFSRPLGKLTKLRVTSVDSVDAGAGRGVTAELVKRDPEWRDPSFSYWQEQKMLKADHPHHELSDIVSDLDEHRLGRDSGFLKIQNHFNKFHYSLDRTDPRTGKPVHASVQLQKWLDHSPEGQRANMALKRAWDDSHDEKIAALSKYGEHGGADLDEAHRRNRERGGQEHASPEQTMKADKHGLTPAMSNGAIRKLNELADKLVGLAKRDKVPMTFARAFCEIAKTDEGRALLQVDAFFRGIR
jgi:hypothetical protein